MSNTIHRRHFLKCSAAALGLPLAARAAAPAATPAPGGRTTSPTADPTGLTTHQQAAQIWLRWNNRLVTSYRAHRTQKFPYLFPLAGPLSGLSLTAESSLPWPHHRSLYFGCDRVNGADYWAGENNAGAILSTGPKLGVVTANTAEILDACEWQKPGGPVVMKDTRRILLSLQHDRLHFVDWEIVWTAVEPVQVQKTNHSLFSLRAALELTPMGGGTLLNAEGNSGEKATFGKASAWCDYSGKQPAAGGVIEGIALMNHPRNPWAPCPWFTRDYGFISPTPFNWIEQPWTLEAGKSVTLRYRVVLHAGDAKDAGLQTLYREWAA